MSGKFLKPGAIADVIRSHQRTNAMQKRDGLEGHPVRFTVCGCPDPNCGGWHTVVLERTIPTVEECAAIIRAYNKARPRKRGRA